MPLDTLDCGLDEFSGTYLFCIDQFGKPKAVKLRIFGKPHARLPCPADKLAKRPVLVIT